MPNYTANSNLYKWAVTDSKQTTITEMASNADKIDAALKSHADQLNAKANQTDVDTKMVDLQQQVNSITITGDSSVEAAQARVAAETTYSSLKERLDDSDLRMKVLNNDAIYVESYDNLKIVVADGYDYSPCIQKAFDDAAINNSVIVFPTGKVLLVSQPNRLKNQNGNYIFMNRCVLKRIGLASTSDSPILYYLGLDTIGGTTKTYSYNSGVYIFDGKFTGTGFGVGYKHAIAGEAYFTNCTFDNTLETGVALSGTNGIHFYNCKIAGNKKGIFCAKVAEDSFTVNYTVEGTGWNDGVYVVGGMITCSANGYGVYYSGSNNEGVLKLSNVKLLGAAGATGVFARSFTNFIVDGGWSEYFNGGTVLKADADSTAGNYEPNSFVVRNFQFTNYGTVKADYNIYSRATRTIIEDVVFQGDTLNQHIWYSSGTPNTLRISLSQQPTEIDTTFGTVTFAKANFPDTRDLVITDGTNNYYLQFNSETANGYKYNTYTYQVPNRVKTKEWKYGSYVEEYTITRITNPVLALATTYTINSVDDTSGYCEVLRPIFQAMSNKSKAVFYGGSGVVIVKNPMSR